MTNDTNTTSNAAPHAYESDPWRSSCCNAPVMGEVSAMGPGVEMFGRCSKCKDCTDFYNVETLED